MSRPGLLSAFFLAAGVLAASVGRADATFEGVGIYQSFEEMVAWAAGFETANSDIVEVVEFGRSHQDRPLLAIQISSTPGANNPAKPEFLFTGGVHAREVITSQASYHLAEYLVSGYRAGNGAVLDVLAEREVWIIPNLNPDGRLRVEGGYSRQRKNMQWYDGQNPATYQCGVDLNRNFPHRWSTVAYGSNSIYSETYRGPNVLSSPEAAALWALLQNPLHFSDLLSAIDFHSGAEAILSPWISPNDFEDNPLPNEDREKLDFLAGRMNDLTGYPIDRLGYDSYGTLTDSLYEVFGAYAICEELFEGPWYAPYTDYFKLFNPLDQPGIDAVFGNALASSMFLLSDEAFPMVPEPSVPAMLPAGVFFLLFRLFAFRRLVVRSAGFSRNMGRLGAPGKAFPA